MRKVGTKKERKGQVNDGLRTNIYSCGVCGLLWHEGVRPGDLWREHGDSCDNCSKPCKRGS